MKVVALYHLQSDGGIVTDYAAELERYKAAGHHRFSLGIKPKVPSSQTLRRHQISGDFSYEQKMVAYSVYGKDYLPLMDETVLLHFRNPWPLSAAWARSINPIAA